MKRRMNWSVLGQLLLLQLLCGLSVVFGQQNDRYYSIVAPRVVRPNSEYHVAVSIIGLSQPMPIFVEVSAQLDSGNPFNVFETIVVEPYATRIVKLQIGDEGPGKYQLLARGVGEFQFVNSTELDYVGKSYSVFIQTDRAVYKPGSKVQFRCIVLDSRLRPPPDSQLDVYITDGQGNRIKQWKRPRLHQGVFTGELELSQSPVLGDWEIVGTIGGQITKKAIQVAEYVLPKFEVTIDAPAHATFKEGKINVIVHAKYTYGKPVKGEATVTAFPDIYSSVIQPIYQNPVRKTVKIDGKATVDFDIFQDLRVTEDDYRRPVVIEVAVEEEVTGRRQNNSMQITLHKHKYTMELLRTAEYYKPGLKYTAFLKVTYHDGTPVQDNTNPVHISYGYTYDQDNLNNMTRMLDKNGMIELDFYPPLVPENIYRPLRIEAQYLNLHEWFPSTSPATSRSDSYIQATLRSENPKVGDYIEIEVNSTSILQYLSYQVLGRGDVLNAASIQVPDRRTATFQFLATYVMAPVAHVLIYYVKQDGELVADSLDVELDGTLQNFVDIATVSDEFEPRDNVTLTISAKPNSYIGILAVDQRSILLKSGNDLTHDQVRKELMSYDTNESAFYGDEGYAHAWIRPGSASTDEVFRKTGSVVLTNGYVHENPQLTLEDTNRVRGPEQGLSFSTIRPDIGPPVRYKFPTRPGWAGRWAFSYVPLTAWRPRVFLMHDISDTWLFSNMSSGHEGKTVIGRTIPDSITSWVLTGFSVNAASGLGLIEAPKKLRVFKPFFISLNLPYSVIRGEIVAVPVVVFNYMNKDLNVEVILEHSDDYEFAEVSNEVHDTKRFELSRTKKVFVQSNTAKSVSFMIIPVKLNHITIKATARSVMAGDSIEHSLLVKAEGETQYKNKVIFADLRTEDSIKANVTVDIPRYFVADSEYVEVSAVGDILGPSIPNLSKLLKMPFGCGEQNMLNFVPNIVILEYLKNTNQLSPAIENKALRYLETGYQQELTYRHKDGSFSAFGKSDPSGSTWLTAFVAKSFHKARDYITVDEKIVSDGLKWLAEKQAANGSFPEVGTVSHRDMQGGAAKGLALTAYVLTAFLEVEDGTDGRYRNTVYKGIDYIVRNMQGLDDNYALAICTYALGLARNAYEDDAFRRLEMKATTKEDLKWWTKPVAEEDRKNPWFSLSRGVDVEMTSYALMSYVRRGMLTDATSIMKWLVKQRNVEGGFASTQDTVVGLDALSKLAEKLRTNIYDVTVKIVTDQGEKKEIHINSQNFMIVQKHVLLGKTRAINITASGTGFALVQVTSRYNLNVTGAFPLFTLDPQVDTISTADHLQLSICSGFIPTKEANESNMVVMEVSFPSGFTVDQDALPSLELSKHVKRVETKNGDTMVVLYFDKMTREEYCPTVSAYRTHKIAKQKPVPVSIYDYYDSSRRARVFYEPKMKTLCDICEGEECGDVCSISAGKRQDDPLSSTSSSSTIIVNVALVLACVFLLPFDSRALFCNLYAR